jgi:hypothetical protein
MLTIDGTTTAPPHHRLVLASGSQVVLPALPGAEHLFDVDTLTGRYKRATPTCATTHSSAAACGELAQPILGPAPGRFDQLARLTYTGRIPSRSPAGGRTRRLIPPVVVKFGS